MSLINIKHVTMGPSVLLQNLLYCHINKTDWHELLIQSYLRKSYLLKRSMVVMMRAFNVAILRAEYKHCTNCGIQQDERNDTIIIYDI